MILEADLIQNDNLWHRQGIFAKSNYPEEQAPLSTSSENDSDDEGEGIAFSDKLSSWVSEHSITHRATNALLKLLVDEGLPVPLDRRTLCNSVRHVPVTQKCGGDYLYIGLKTGIEKQFGLGHFTSRVILDFGVDGIPIYSSSKSELWPILARFGSCDPFLVSCYYGKGKPNSPASFLEDLVDELGNLHLNQQYLHREYSISIGCFICDAPARSFLKGTVSHTGYYSCERCTIKGSREGGRVVLYKQEENIQKRTDSSFRNFDYHIPNEKSHQHIPSPLAGLQSFDLIKSFVLDKMHMVDLGVMRRMLYSFKGKVKGIRRTKLSSNLLKQINLRLTACNGKLPSEFNRQPRSLDDLDYWKATELRSFLLYSGMVVLKGIVADDVYEHFLCLCLAMTLLSCPDDERRNGSITFCRELLARFAGDAAALYGGPFVVYNVHSVQHIPDDVEFHNVPLQRIDAFCFENKLKDLKSYIKGPENPLAQVYQRTLEKQRSTQSNGKAKVIKVSCKPKDSCFETDDKVLVVKRIVNKKYICLAYSKRNLYNLFSKPKQSKDFGIFYVPAKSKCKVVEMSDYQMVNKCVKLPFKDGFVVVPMIEI